MRPASSLPYLIVDGYNVIGQAYRDLFERDPDTARAALVDEVSSFAAGRFETLVVFDAHANSGSDGAPHEVAGIQVVFSPAGVEADAVIERRAFEASAAGRRVVVVTSDSATRDVVGRSGVRVQSSDAFASEMGAVAEAAHGHAGEVVRTRVEDLVDEETRRRLMEWARGL